MKLIRNARGDMNVGKLSASMLFIGLLTGCIHWPNADTSGMSPDEKSMYERIRSSCIHTAHQKASNMAWGAMGDLVTAPLAGAAVGAATGSALSAGFGGSAARGAALGAAEGAIVGTIIAPPSVNPGLDPWAGAKWEHDYAAWCLYQSGYSVTD